MSPPERHHYYIEHISVYRYANQVHRSIISLRLQPKQESYQQIRSFVLTLTPTAERIPFPDSFGNLGHLCTIITPHTRLKVHSRLSISTTGQGYIPDQLGKTTWQRIKEIANPVDYWDYLTPSKFVRNSTYLQEFCEDHGIARLNDPLSSILQASRTIFETFLYNPGSTRVDSPVEQILITKAGVCQDYSHVLLSIGRNWGIPSRYVSGYLHLEGIAGEQSPSGESHAWTEFLFPDLGWVGIDPTNNTFADHRHVKIAVGRDYADVSPTRGIEYGGGYAELDVQVIVKDCTTNDLNNGQVDSQQ